MKHKNVRRSAPGVGSKSAGEAEAAEMLESQPASRSLTQVVSDDMPALNTTFRRVAEYLVAAPSKFMHGSVQEIAAAASVSEPSVVRFCRRYGFKGIPDFRIALAMSLARDVLGASFLEPGIGDKAVTNLREKRAIAKAARDLVVDCHSIIIDSGSTAQLFAETLRDAEPLVILTTGLNIVDALRGAAQHTILLPGGELRQESRSLTGRLVENTIASMHFDALFLGADAIDAQSGLSTFNMDEAHQNAAMIDVSARVVVLADSTKFRAPRLHRFCDIDRIHTIITDTGLDDEIAAAIADRDLVLRRVDASEEPTA